MVDLQQWGSRVSARTRRTIAIALLGFSAFSTLLGMRALTTFDQKPGVARTAPMRWPASSAIRRFKGRPEIVVFVHPFCSCTVATMAELAQLSVRRKPGVATPVITVLFFRPHNSGWAPNDLWKKAQTLEGANVVWDDDGLEARRFGARTSGYALLYSSEGNLLFRGGVTGSRGHQGDNFGLDELAASVDSQLPARAASRVFGCALGGLDEETDGKL
jgi:hypothetical protein